MTAVLIPLKQGSESEPLFIAHGMGGRAGEFVNLVRFVRTDQSIYGLEAKGNDGVEQPFERIEDLARYSLDAIKIVQPRGPYYLAGFSLGGLVAFEMAQQLSSNGDIVAFLGMMDSYPHPKKLSWWQRTRLSSRRIKRRAFDTFRSTISTPQFKNYDHHADERIVSPIDPPSVTRLAHESAYRAWKHYHPQFYPGKIYFIKAEVTTIYPDDPVAVWGKLASQLEVQIVPANHDGVLATHFELTGAVLSRYLREVNSGPKL